MSDSVASTPLMQACALYDAADKIAWMAGEPTEDFVRWLTAEGGLTQMALAFFRAPASGEPSGAEAVVREAVGALAEIHEALSRAWSSGILPASVISADLAQRCGALIRKHRLPTAPGAPEEGAGES